MLPMAPGVANALNRQLDQAPERYVGYKDQLRVALAEVLLAEQRHEIAGTNVQQQVQASCSKLAAQLTGKDNP